MALSSPAARTAAGFSGWNYSDDSLWMKMASGRSPRIARIASTLALTMCSRAVTNERSSVSCSFHQAFQRRELRADGHLVDRRVELHPREPLREGAGIVGEQPREIAVLEVADPVRHTEVAQVDDRHDVHPQQLGEHLVGELPVEAFRAQPDPMDRRAVAQVADPEVIQQRQVGAPVPVVPAQLQFVHAGAPGTDGGIAALDPGGEHEARLVHTVRGLHGPAWHRCLMRAA